MDSPVQFVFWIFIIALSLALYFLPATIATVRKCQRVNAMFLCNLFFGWTMLGWILVLIWSILGETE